MNIRAMQHVYGSIDRSQSYQNRDGFQTIFVSRGLSEEDIRRIEGKLSYFNYRNEPIVKTVFFPLGNGLYLLSRTAITKETDDFGRAGSYMSHSFVIRDQEFINAGFDPFIVLEVLTGHFISDISEAFSSGNTRTGDIPELSIALTDAHANACRCSAEQELKSWDSNSIDTLINCALQNELLRKQRRSLVIAGNSASIVSALRAIFSIVPASISRNLSFDTHFYRCNNIGNYFWSVGYPELPANTGQNIVVNIAERKIVGADELTMLPSTLESWLHANTRRRDFLYMMNYKNAASHVVDLLQEKPGNAGNHGHISPQVAKEIFELNWPSVARVIEGKLNGAVGSVLASRLLGTFLTEFRYWNPDYQLAVLAEGIGLNEINNALVKTYLKNAPSSKELHDLEKLLQRKGHDILESMLCFWKKDFKELRHLIEQLTDNDYRVIVGLLLNKVPLDVLFCMNKMTIFLDVFAEIASRDSNVAKLTPRVVKALLRRGNQARLNTLSPVLQHLGYEDLKSIDRLVYAGDTRGIPVEFLVTLDQAYYRNYNQCSRSNFRSFLSKVLRR